MLGGELIGTGVEFVWVVDIVNSGVGVCGAPSSLVPPSWKYQTPFDATV